MPHYVPNEYSNIFRCHIFTEQISEHICMPEIARIRIQIIFEDHFIQTFKYSYSSLNEEIKCYTGYYFMHKLYLDLICFIKKDKANIRIRF